MVRATAWTVLVLGALLAAGGLLGVTDPLVEGQYGQVLARLLVLAVISVGMVRAVRQLRPGLHR